MNTIKFEFNSPNPIYHIKNSKFTFYPQDPENTNDYTELTTEQFIELFGKKETELDKWLKEIKAKNLSLEKLIGFIEYVPTCPHNEVWRKLKGETNEDKAQILFNQWNNPTEESPKVETEWQPKRGDRVLVWDNSEEPLNAIYLETVIGCTQPFLVVDDESEESFLKGNEFDFVTYKHMKPLPIEQQTEDKVEVASEIYAEQNAKDDNISYHNLFSPLKYAFINGAKWQSEQPIETNFKSKVIDYLEDNTNFNEDRAKEYIERDIIEVALKHKLAANHNKLILEKIKQL
jgi:hypothetical protein